MSTKSPPSPIDSAASPARSAAQPRQPASAVAGWRHPAAGQSGARLGWLRGRTGRTVGLVLALALLVFFVLLSLAVGARSIPLGDVWDALTQYDPANGDHAIIHSMRVPRTILGLIAGVALGLSGAVMQGVARNPLADPGILGVNSGAAVGVLIAIQYFGMASLLQYVWFAFIGAAVVAVGVYMLGSLGREGATPVKLALAGSAVTALLSSIATLMVLSSASFLAPYRTWVVGALAGRGADIIQLVWPFTAVGAVMALMSGRLLNALALGDDVARSLGQKVGRARLFAAACVMLLAGSATAAAGPITFVGLAVPHIARMITGPDYRWVLPYSAVIAPALLLCSDVLGRVVVRPGELQVGIVTALLGAPFFIALVRRPKIAEL